MSAIIRCYLYLNQGRRNIQSIWYQHRAEVFIRLQIVHTDPINLGNGHVTRQLQTDRLAVIFSNWIQATVTRQENH